MQRMGMMIGLNADKIAEYSASLGGRHWEPSPLLRRLADDGGKLQTYSN